MWRDGREIEDIALVGTLFRPFPNGAFISRMANTQLRRLWTLARSRDDRSALGFCWSRLRNPERYRLGSSLFQREIDPCSGARAWMCRGTERWAKMHTPYRRVCWQLCRWIGGLLLVAIRSNRLPLSNLTFRCMSQLCKDRNNHRAKHG